MKPLRFFVFCSIFLSAMLALAGPADQGAMAGVVALQNQWRQEAGVGGTLTWHQGIADSAQSWADNIAARGVMEHDMSDGWWQAWSGSAENIAPGGSPEQAAQLWYAEKARYEEVVSSGRQCRPDSIGMEAYQRCGHYANIVGPSTHIGCGMAGEYLVCRYVF